ncbi:polyamine ABC transporter substrate-binding protein [Bradyrhizobium sp. 83012]|uniref:Polyamine ABC transporter substrate-binding protein n=1 Tax=Bradyrhizobium aeschynomenes TaxID=2734909 RepID=A0ABX2CFT8_9BRAD|nr:ABC transporter substrate-binding protein [Bradyrhizobium aeschynomenes]NPU66335.1 polyamine ABC transporter substrate-binding protein [Bradyrhizobium aeschynomenes]
MKFGYMNRVSIMAFCIAVIVNATGDVSAAEVPPGTALQIGAGGSDVTTLDPHRATTSTDKPLIGLMFNGLVRFRPGSADPKDLEPDLAERWETSADGRVLTFFIRKGVKFHGNWGTLTADDVVYSLTRAADPSRSSFAADFGPVESIAKLDEYTVRIVLKYPDPNVLGRLSNYHGGNIVCKRAVEELGDKLASNPVGTGPFAFSEHETQRHVKLVANEGYFRGRPQISNIVYRTIPSDSARELAFSSGELDVIQGRREQRWVDTTRQRGNMVVDVFRPGEFRTLHINSSIPPLDDLRVRQAIAAAINVDDLVQFVGKSVSLKGCSVVPPSYIGEDCSSGAYAYDPVKAKALLAEAGHPNGLTLKVVVSNISAILPTMEIIQRQLAKAGIKLEMSVVDHATYQSQIRGNASALVFYGAARFPVADTYLTEFYHSRSSIGTTTAVANFSHCDVADAEIQAARVEGSVERQQELWKEAQRKIHDTVCSVPLFELQQVWGHSKRVNYGYELKGAMNLAPPITEATTLMPR